MNSYVIIKVSGKNIDRYINTILKYNINLLNINKISIKEVILKIREVDYKKLLEIKTSYEIEIIKEHTLGYWSHLIKSKLNHILGFFLFIIIIYLLSNTVFSIKVEHSNKGVRQLILNDLSLNGVNRFSFVKNYEKMTKVKENIINKHKDKIEWLEIKRIGVHLVVNVEIRNIPNKNSPDIYDIVSTKDAVIKKIIAYNGLIVKETEEYVRKGEVIISSNIMVNGELKQIVNADGKIYGEVWYKVRVEYPYLRVIKDIQEEHFHSLKISLLNRDFVLFNRYKFYSYKDRLAFKSKFIPFSVSYSKINKMIITPEINTYDMAYIKALEKAKISVINNLDKEAYITNQKTLKISEIYGKIVVDVFISTYENITGKVKVGE